MFIYFTLHRSLVQTNFHCSHTIISYFTDASVLPQKLTDDDTSDVHCRELELYPPFKSTRLATGPRRFKLLLHGGSERKNGSIVDMMTASRHVTHLK